MALWYTGGLLKHAAAFVAIIAPATNSYKRLVPGYEAPVNLAYSRRNRSAAVRIPMYSDKPESQAAGVPSARSHPAILTSPISAMLMAGLDGIENKIDPGPPLDKDIFELLEEEAANVPSMPGSLDGALGALKKDHEFLTKGGVFTKDFIDLWINYKKNEERTRSGCARTRTSSICITIFKDDIGGFS